MIEQEKSNAVAFWCNHIAQYEKDYQTWEARSKKIIKRYRDERTQSENGRAQFNILWSNVQTLGPALYDRNPIPNIDRRFQIDDQLGTVAAQVLERCVSYYVDSDDFGNVMRQVVKDRLLPGRGVAWVRYVPNFKDADVQGSIEVRQEGAQTTDDQIKGEEAEPELYSEDVVVDYVHWQDFGHTWARTWQEVRAVWRAVPMSRNELIARFGEEIGKAVPMDSGRKEDKTPEDLKRATVYEIWDKTSKKAFWVNKDYPDVLDERQDPLKLKNFFPCPMPIYSTISNDSLVPTPDYIQYQDQAKELDDLTARINQLVKALKVIGIYDASAQGLQRMLGEGMENTMIPVENFAVLGEKGGIKGVVDFFPVEQVAGVLTQLYDARDRVKQDLYEVTGISDVIRGATDPNETLGAQELKGKYAGLRIGAMQADVARFARDVVRIFAEIIADHFSIETIKALSGYKLMTAQEKQMAQEMAKMQPDQPMPDEVKEMMELPTWEDIAGLIKDDTARCFRIDIETDSTVKVDQDADKAARNEFLTAAGGFIQQAVMMPPDLQPLVMEMLKFGIKGFKISRELETTFDMALKEIKAKAENPMPPEPDPAIAAEQAKLQQDAELRQEEMQQNASFKAEELNIKRDELALKQADLQLRQQDMEYKYGLENKKIDADLTKTRIDAKTKVPVDIAMTDPEMNDGNEITPIAAILEKMTENMGAALQSIAEMQMQSNQAIIDAIQNPPARKVIRDAQGKIAGVE